jgi:hypothetical protein
VDLVGDPVEGGDPVRVVVPERQLRLQARHLGPGEPEGADGLEQLVRVRPVLGVEDGQEGTPGLVDPAHRDVHRVGLGLRPARRYHHDHDVGERTRLARLVGVEPEPDGASGPEGLLVVLLDEQEHVQALPRVFQPADPGDEVAEHVRLLVHRQQDRVVGQARILGTHRDPPRMAVRPAERHDDHPQPGDQHVEEDAQPDQHSGRVHRRERQAEPERREQTQSESLLPPAEEELCGSRPRPATTAV